MTRKEVNALLKEAKTKGTKLGAGAFGVAYKLGRRVIKVAALRDEECNAMMYSEARAGEFLEKHGYPVAKLRIIGKTTGGRVVGIKRFVAGETWAPYECPPEIQKKIDKLSNRLYRMGVDDIHESNVVLDKYGRFVIIDAMDVT